MCSKEAGGRQNILVINDEAHHAYRIPPKLDDQDDDQPDDDDEDAEEAEASRKEATIWVDGLDKIATAARHQCLHRPERNTVFPRPPGQRDRILCSPGWSAISA